MFRIAVEDTASAAVKMLGDNLKDKAKLRKAARGGAKVVKKKMSSRLVPKYGATKSKRKGNYKNPRPYYTSRGSGQKAVIFAGNLRKSAIILKGLKKTGRLIIGHRLGGISAGMIIGKTKGNSRGYYGHIVHQRQGYQTRVYQAARPQAQKELTRGFIELFNQEKRKAGFR